ncbi:MAG: PilW family protein [Thiobacillaceae bacterium]
MTNIKYQRGVGVVEIMVALVIALFLLLGLATIFSTTESTYGSQQGLSTLQDSERLATVLLTNAIQTGGYFPNPDVTISAAAFPVVANAYMIAGQPVAGASGPPDTVRARYVTAPGDTIENCNGGANPNPVGGANVLYDNVFSLGACQVNPVTGINSCYLQCSVNGGAAQSLVGGINTMTVLYGVDTTASAPPAGSATTYMTATAVTNWNGGTSAWNYVKSVRITLTFVNPMAGTPGQPNTLSFTSTIPVMNRI